MKGTVNAAALSAAIKTAQTIIVAGTKIDALKHVRLMAKDGQLEAEATNLDQHIAVRCEAKLSDGVAIIDPARLLTALQPISGDATLSCTDGFMSVTGKGSRSRLALLPSDTWQNIERPAPGASFDVYWESLVDAFEAIGGAVGDDPSRPYLSGAHLKWEGPSLIAEACDGVLLLTREIKARRPDGWPKDCVIVPREFMLAAAKITTGDSATLSVTLGRVILTTSAGWLASKLIEGTYPAIDRIWDKAAAPALRADRKSLLGIVKLAYQFCDTGSSTGRLIVIHNGEVMAEGRGGEMFRASIECEYIKEQTYSFQPKYLLAALTALSSETVDLTDGGSRPDVITIQGDGARLCAVAQVSPPAWWCREMASEKAEAA